VITDNNHSALYFVLCTLPLLHTEAFPLGCKFHKNTLVYIILRNHCVHVVCALRQYLSNAPAQLYRLLYLGTSVLNTH